MSRFSKITNGIGTGLDLINSGVNVVANIQNLNNSTKVDRGQAVSTQNPTEAVYQPTPEEIALKNEYYNSLIDKNRMSNAFYMNAMAQDKRRTDFAKPENDNTLLYIGGAVIIIGIFAVFISKNKK